MQPVEELVSEQPSQDFARGGLGDVGDELHMPHPLVAGHLAWGLKSEDAVWCSCSKCGGSGSLDSLTCVCTYIWTSTWVSAHSF